MKAVWVTWRDPVANTYYGTVVKPHRCLTWAKKLSRSAVRATRIEVFVDGQKAIRWTWTRPTKP